MAQASRYVCSHCQHNIEAWSDGNPYYINKTGAKQYAYHPSSLFDLCIGNDSPHLCLSCGHEFMVDSRDPATACPECGSSQFVGTYQLEDHPCPYSKSSQFSADPNFFRIS